MKREKMKAKLENLGIYRGGIVVVKHLMYYDKCPKVLSVCLVHRGDM